MELNCPKCQSENTQKITAIVDGGTTHSRGTTHSVGMGSVGGKMAMGSSVGTTNTTHKTALAQKLNKPSKKSEAVIVPTVLVGGALGAIAGSIVGSMTFSLLGIAAFGGVVYFFHQKFSKTAAINRAYNLEEFPAALNTWENGFYCHRCEHVFTPG